MSDPVGLLGGLRFLSRIQGFLDRLREEGVVVGIGAGLDLGRAVDLISPLDRSAFREACRATLGKSPADLRTIDRVFEEYWSTLGPPPVPPASEEGKVPRPRDRRGHPRPLPPRQRRTGPEAVTETLEGRYSARAPDPAHPAQLVSPSELRRYRIGARRFRRQVATLPGRTWRRAPSGPVDFRRTAGRSARTGGEWIELFRRDRATRRADLIVLWDVSGSMREHTSALFALVHSLHRVIRRTRIFAFGHAIEEVTGLFEGQSYVRALPQLSGRLAGTGGGTQIAYCLTEFYRHWGALLRPTTTVLIVSDGWDLGDVNRLRHELERIRGSVARLAWVNPYAAEKGFTPSTAALRTALPFLNLFASPVDFPRPHGTRGATDQRPATPGPVRNRPT